MICCGYVSYKISYPKTPLPRMGMGPGGDAGRGTPRTHRGFIADSSGPSGPHAKRTSRRVSATRSSPASRGARNSWRKRGRGQDFLNLPTFPASGLWPVSHRASMRQGLTWGITGSVGFALATGIPVMRPHSDPRSAVACSFDRCLGTTRRSSWRPYRYFPVRIDVQVDTSRGAFALSEMGQRTPPASC